MSVRPCFLAALLLLLVIPLSCRKFTSHGLQLGTGPPTAANPFGCKWNDHPARAAPSKSCPGDYQCKPCGRPPCIPLCKRK